MTDVGERRFLSGKSLHAALIATLWFALLCTVANAMLLWLPLRRAELSLWRRLNLQALRRRLTRQRKVDQPLSTQTTAIARRNIAWHVAMSLVMFIIVAKSMQSDAVAFHIAALLCALPCAAWLTGSCVQRQKIAVLFFSGLPTRAATGTPVDVPR